MAPAWRKAEAAGGGARGLGRSCRPSCGPPYKCNALKASEFMDVTADRAPLRSLRR